MSDHDGHTINVGPVTVGETLARPPVENHHAVLWGPEATAQVDRLRAENAALRELIARFYTQTWQDPLTAEQSTLLDSIVQEADRG